MPTLYPGGMDTTGNLPTTRADGTPQVTVHPADHDTVNGAVLALEGKVGGGNSGPSVGTLLTGTGTGTSAWITAALSGMYDVQAYGAVANGSTVNTTPIQNAINACAAAGGGAVWFLGHGTYISGNITVPAGVTLAADGATIKAVAGLVGELITPMGNNVVLRGLTLDGNANTNSAVGFGTTTTGFVMDRCFVQNAHYGLQAGNSQTAIRVTDNTFTNTNANAISFQANGTTALVRGNYISGCQAGIQFFPGAAGGASDIVIVENTVRNTTALPIECQYGTRVIVSNNDVSGSGTNGLSIGQATYVTITGNTIRDQTNEGIELAVGAAVVGNSNYTVTGNTITTCGMGIIADQMTNISITGNTISNTNVSDGIRLTGPSRATVSGNTITDPFANGVSILNDSSSNPANDVHVVGNTFVFTVARTATPCAVNIGTSNRAVVESNHIETSVDVVSGSLNFQGPIIFTGTPNYPTVRNNTILATTAAVAKHTAISIQGSVTPVAAHIVGNRIRNFQTGIDTTNSADAATIVQSNSVVACTTAYTLNATTMPVVGYGAAGALYMGNGVPPVGLGSNGDFYQRNDGTVAGHTVMYHKESGAWAATAA